MNALSAKERKQALVNLEAELGLGGAACELLLIELIMRTGSRECEAWRLPADRIDDTQGVIWIKAAKGSKDHAVPVPIPFAKRLKAHLAAHGHILAPMYCPTSEDSATARMRKIWARWRLALCGPKGASLGLHGLRASFAQALIGRGRQLPEVQQLMGHKNLSSTGRYLAMADVLARRKGILNALAE